MTPDLANLYDELRPWAVRLTIDGASRPLRRLSNVDLARLYAVGSMTPGERRSFLASLVGPLAWRDEVEAAVFGAVCGVYEGMIVRHIPRPRKGGAAGGGDGFGWQHAVLAAAELLSGTPVAEVWRMPADVTIELLATGRQRREAASGSGGGGGGPARSRGPGGTVIETTEGELALGMMDGFMARRDPATGEYKLPDGTPFKTETAFKSVDDVKAFIAENAPPAQPAPAEPRPPEEEA